jgi:hypothetical protein
MAAAWADQEAELDAEIAALEAAAFGLDFGVSDFGACGFAVWLAAGTAFKGRLVCGGLFGCAGGPAPAGGSGCHFSSSVVVD